MIWVLFASCIGQRSQLVTETCLGEFTEITEGASASRSCFSNTREYSEGMWKRNLRQKDDFSVRDTGNLVQWPLLPRVFCGSVVKHLDQLPEGHGFDSNQEHSDFFACFTDRKIIFLMYSLGSKFTDTSLSLCISTYRHLVLAVRVQEGRGHVSRKLINNVRQKPHFREKRDLKSDLLNSLLLRRRWGLWKPQGEDWDKVKTEFLVRVYQDSIVSVRSQMFFFSRGLNRQIHILSNKTKRLTRDLCFTGNCVSQPIRPGFLEVTLVTGCEIPVGQSFLLLSVQAHQLALFFLLVFAAYSRSMVVINL